MEKARAEMLHQARIEQLIHDIHEADAAREEPGPDHQEGGICVRKGPDDGLKVDPVLE